MNETIRNILKRRSIRGFKSEQISKEDIETIMNCALHAPSAMNTQNWFFSVIQTQEVIDELNAQISELLPEDAKQRAIARNGGDENYSVFYYSPTVIVLSANLSDKWSEVNCSMAAQNICLAAQSLNLGTCVIGMAAPLFKSDKAEQWHKKLNVPKDYQPIYAISVGYPNIEMLKPERIKNKVSYI